MTILNATIIEFDLPNRSFRSIALEDFYTQEMDPSKVYWIHADLTKLTEFKKLAKKIELPDNVVKMCAQTNTISELIDLDSTLTMKFQCIREKTFSQEHIEHFGNLVIHLTSQYCFTASKYALPALAEFQNHIPKAVKFGKTSCFILFIILDNAITDYAQFLFNFEVISDQMDIKVRENHEDIYAELTNTKHRVMEIKRCTVAIREILMRLSGRKISVVSEECRASIINLFNQSQMIFHEIDSIRDMLNGLLSQIDYSLMHNMNKSMQVLTGFAAIFLPLTLITGIYGMNFHNMPELKWEYGYYYALLLIAFLGIALLIIFKKNKWF